MEDEIKKVNEVVVTPPVPAVVAPAAEEVVDTRDYKKELADKEKELGQAQHVIVGLKKSGKEKEDDDDLVDDPVITTEVIDEKLEKFKVEQSAEIFNDELAKLTDNPDKLALIKFTYDNKIMKGGFTRASIQADLASAQAIVERPQQDTIIGELKKAGISDKTKIKVGQGAGQDLPITQGATTEQMLTPMDKKIMARSGITLDEINNGIKK